MSQDRITTTGPKRTLGIDDRRGLRYCSVLCRDYWTGVNALLHMGPWDILYLDHDLHCWDNGKEYTGYDLISWLEEVVLSGELTLPGDIVCVSDNASGRERIQLVIDKLYKRGQFRE